jgi:hypothetical protein
MDRRLLPLATVAKRGDTRRESEEIRHMNARTITVGIMSMALPLCGCGVTSQLHSEIDFDHVSAERVMLDESGVGVLTPSAPTGQESDRQALGDALGAALGTALPGAHVMPLADMLSAVNRAGLARAYADMLAEYENTGILERDGLQRIGEAGGVRYLAKVNLGDFTQSSDKRLSIAGIRMFDTWRAKMRVHLEIWDSLTGEIAWQGNEELVFAREGVKEKPVSFSQVARLVADHLVARVGESGSETSDVVPPALAANDDTADSL